MALELHDTSRLILMWVEWAVLVTVFVGAARIALKPPFRRDFAALPGLALGLSASALCGGALALWLLWYFPALRHAAALGSTIAIAFLVWRARPTYKRRAGWPPGSLGFGASLDAIDNKAFYLQQAALHGPVFKMSQFGRPVLCVVG